MNRARRIERAVVESAFINWQPKVCGCLAAVGNVLLYDGGPKWRLTGLILNSLSMALLGVTVRQANVTSKRMGLDESERRP